MKNDYPNVVFKAPWLFRFFRFLAKIKIPGSYRIISGLRRLGLFNVIVRQDVSEHLTIDFPLFFHDEYAYDGKNYLDRQDTELVNSLGNVIELVDAPVTLIDCGADIGLVTAFSTQNAKNITTAIAIEPNTAVSQILQKNLSRLSVPTQCLEVALSSYSGMGTLASPQHDASFHARYIRQVSGDSPDAIKVMKLDDMSLEESNHLLLKIDVEGGEFDVIRGARDTLSRASGFTIIFEAHPFQIQRSGNDPCKIIAYLGDLAPVYSVIIGDPENILDPQRPYLSQIGGAVNRDIFCTTDEGLYEALKEQGVAPFVSW